jgi:hypothetical protein
MIGGRLQLRQSSTVQKLMHVNYTSFGRLCDGRTRAAMESVFPVRIGSSIAGGNGILKSEGKNAHSSR